MEEKVYIDCDAGVDDALALILAFHSPELEGAGDHRGPWQRLPGQSNDQHCQDSDLLRPPRQPWIARGADRPITGSPVHAESYHGEDGLGGAQIQADEAGGWGKAFLSGSRMSSSPSWPARIP